MTVSLHTVWYFYISATGFGWFYFRTQYFELVTHLCLQILQQILFKFVIAQLLSFLFPSSYLSYILYSFHCFCQYICFIQVFSNIAPINTIIPTSFFYIIVVVSILYIHNYSCEWILNSLKLQNCIYNTRNFKCVLQKNC